MVSARSGRGHGDAPPVDGGKPTAACRLTPSHARRARRNIGPVWGAVLIVDDNPRFRARARRRLEDDGWNVVAEAADGASALTTARRHQPDIVLLDIGLPDVSGLAVAEQLAREPDGPAVVLTSTHDAADFGERIAHCGARGFLPKTELSGAALAAILS
jgi:DNA-binding NarL/FixJ family response regulator